MVLTGIICFWRCEFVLGEGVTNIGTVKGYVRICRKVKGLGLQVDRYIIKHKCYV